MSSYSITLSFLLHGRRLFVIARDDLDTRMTTRWAGAPAPAAAEPGALLEGWVFLYWAGLAPPVDLSDMEDIADGRELAGLAYLLGGLQRDFERRGAKMGRTTAWPVEYPDMWPAEADAAIASLLGEGLRGLEEKLRVA